MPNAMYGKGREYLTAPLVADTIKAVLVYANNYTPNLVTHNFLSDIPENARMAISPALATKVNPDGVFDAEDTLVAAVTGAAVDYIVLYKDTGDAATSPLILLINTGTGLPFTPNGADVLIVWSQEANRILALI